MKQEYSGCIYNPAQSRKVLTHYASASFLAKWNASNLKENDTNINKELICEHGLLKPVEHKAKVSTLLWDYLSNEFPESRAFPMTENECAQCSQVKRESVLFDESLKSTKLDEKNLYNDVFKKQYLFPNCLKPEKTYYMIPKNWAQDWKKYVNSPTAPHPGIIDNQFFIGFDNEVEHGDHELPMFLNLDPVEDQLSFYIIEENDWKGLIQIYGGGPAITIMKSGQKFITSPPTNDTLITQRKIDDSNRETNFQMGTISVTYKAKGGKKNALVTKNLKVKTNAGTTVDTFKLQIFEVAEIDPACQSLFFNKTKLQNHKTLAFYGVKENSTIELEIGEGNDDASWTDVFNVHEHQHSIEEGFKGSVLHDTGSLSSSNNIHNTKSAQDSPSTSLPKSPARSNTSNNSPSNNNNNNNNNNKNNNNTNNNNNNNNLEQPYWACATCTVHNYEMDADTCGVCGDGRPKEATKVVTKPDIWNCGSCTLENDIKETNCGACDEPRIKQQQQQQQQPRKK
jgi:hypothetical protein